MKVLKIIFISILSLILLVLIGVFIFLKTFDLNKYLPQITQQVGQVIHRPVEIRHATLDFNFVKGIALKVEGLKIKDDPAFSNKDFLTVDQVQIGLDFMALLKKEFQFTDIVITSAHVSIIRSTMGQINAATMVPAAAPAASPVSSEVSLNQVQVPNPPATPAVPVALPALSVHSITFEKAQISFEDQNPQMPVSLLIEDIEAKISHFSLTEDFNFTAMLNLMAQDKKNVSITGQCKLDLSKNAVLIKNLKVNTDLILLDWEKISKITPMLSKLPAWPKEVNGQLSAEATQLLASDKGLGNASFQVTLGADYLKLKDSNISLKANIQGKFQGQIEGVDPLASLKGEGNLLLTDGKIEGFNVLKTILSKLDFIPGIAAQIEAGLSSSVKDKLGNDTTMLEKAGARFKVDHKTIFIDEAELQSNLFSILTKGTLGFDLIIDMDVKTYLSADLSADLVKAIRPLRGLLDEQNRLYIPGKISGQAPAIAYRPDAALAKNIAVQEGADQLQKVLDKNPEVNAILNAVLGGGGNSNSSAATPEEGQEQQPAKKLINDVLNKILRE